MQRNLFRLPLDIRRIIHFFIIHNISPINLKFDFMKYSAWLHRISALPFRFLLLLHDTIFSIQDIDLFDWAASLRLPTSSPIPKSLRLNPSIINSLDCDLCQRRVITFVSVAIIYIDFDAFRAPTRRKRSRCIPWDILRFHRVPRQSGSLKLNKWHKPSQIMSNLGQKFFVN